MYLLNLVGTSLLFICFIYAGHMTWNYILEHYSKRRIIDKNKSLPIQQEQEYISSFEKESMKESLLEFANTISEKI